MKMTNIRLGINNAFASKRWPEPMAWSRLIAGDLGLTEVQFSFDLLDPLLPEPGRSESVESIWTAIRRHSLHVHTTFTGSVAYGQSLFGHPESSVREHARQWYAAAIKLTVELGAEATGGHMGTISVETSQHAERRAHACRRMIGSVVELALEGAECGLKYILWELMPSALEPPHSPAEAVAMLSEANRASAIPIRLCLDLGHCCAPELGGPGDPESWLRQLLPWVRMVHLQQTDGMDDRHWPFVERHRHDGIIDPKRIVDIVQDAPEEVIDLIFEFVHPMTMNHLQVIDDYKRSIETWGALI